MTYTHETCECDSTQELARHLLANGVDSQVVVRAERQRAGRGRGGRTWHTPPGAALLMSIAKRGPLPAHVLVDLPERVMDVVRTQCAQFAQVPIDAIAWSPPNDLHDAATDRKLAGLLIDTAVVGDVVEQVVIGIGVNLTGASFQLPGEARVAGTLESLAGASLPAPASGVQALADAVADEVFALFSA